LLEEELDKLFLKNICDEIMNEVMDWVVTMMSYSLGAILRREALRTEKKIKQT
jgi:hypothetical protein